MASHFVYDKIGDSPRSIHPPSIRSLSRPFTYFEPTVQASDTPSRLDAIIANRQRAKETKDL